MQWFDSAVGDAFPSLSSGRGAASGNAAFAGERCRELDRNRNVSGRNDELPDNRDCDIWHGSWPAAAEWPLISSE
jgi:copper resistance protein C